MDVTLPRNTIFGNLLSGTYPVCKHPSMSPDVRYELLHVCTLAISVEVMGWDEKVHNAPEYSCFRPSFMVFLVKMRFETPTYNSCPR